MMSKKKRVLPIIGWREWIDLPGIGIEKIKVKVDSGARSSSLHAYDVKVFERDSKQWVSFKVHPLQRSREKVVSVEAEVLEFRSVKSSTGIAKMRPVILTDIEILGERFPVEITLASRDNMGFRMLLGREAFRGRFLVDGGRSYYGGKPMRPKKKKVKSQ